MSDTLPEVSYRPGLCIFTWPSGLRVQLERFAEGRERHVSAEIIVKDTHMVGGEWLYLARHTLTSSRSANELIKELSNVYPDFNWTEAVKQVFAGTLQRLRQGEEVTEVGNQPLRSTPKWRLYPIIPEEQIAILYGTGGIGKSLLSLVMGITVQHNYPLLGFQPTQGNVLILDWETIGDEVNERLLALEVGMQLPFHPVLNHLYCHQPLVGMLEELYEKVEDGNIKLVIVDSAVAACGGEENAIKNATPTMNALRSLKVSSLIISHTVKNINTKETSPYGSGFWTYRARNVFEMKAALEEGQTSFPVGLFHRKHNISGRMPPQGFMVSFNLDESITITKSGLEDTGLGKSLPLGSRILSELKHGSMTVEQLVEALEEPANQIRARLAGLKGKKVINLEPGGKGQFWGLLCQEN